MAPDVMAIGIPIAAGAAADFREPDERRYFLMLNKVSWQDLCRSRNPAFLSSGHRHPCSAPRPGGSAIASYANKFLRKICAVRKNPCGRGIQQPPGSRIADSCARKPAPRRANVTIITAVDQYGGSNSRVTLRCRCSETLGQVSGADISASIARCLVPDRACK